MMNTPHTRWVLMFAAAVSLTLGCALLGKGDPGEARFFSLELNPAPPATPTAEPDAPLEKPPAKLRLGRVTGAPYLAERLVSRDATNAMVYYRERRWTEPPQRFLERRLARVLFEQRGLVHLVGGGGPTLEVQLLALDEIRSPRHVARVIVSAQLHDEQVVLFEDTLRQDLPIHDDSPGALVEALGEALQAVTERIADSVVQQLLSTPAPSN